MSSYMKKILIGLLCLVSAGVMAAPKLDFGDRFAFAGLESAKLVPPTGSEILERKVPVRDMEHRPVKDAIYVYNSDAPGAITVEQLNELRQRPTTAKCIKSQRMVILSWLVN